LKTFNTAKHTRKAFTLIELLVSVAIISTSFVFILKLHSTNKKQIVYLSERNKRALSDSLFVTRKIFKYHKDKKLAYDILRDDLKVDELESREILKKEEREIFIPDEIEIIPPPDTRGYSAIVNEVKLKGHHSSHFWHFRIKI